MTTEWQSVFESLAKHLRQEFECRFPFKSDADVSPDTLALRDAFHSFPVSTNVLLVDTAGFSSPLSEGIFWTLLHYDLTKQKTNEVIFHGTLRLADIDAHAALLAESFGLEGQDTLDSIKRLAFLGQTDEGAFRIVQLIPFDIREKLDCYARELTEHLLMFERQELIRRFKKQIDFNALYSLNPEPPLTLETFLQIDPLTKCHVKISDGRPPTIEERHEAIRKIVLIPKVPESVRRVFRLAKQLYLFSYFEYGFFTISQHYAYLALEAAVHARWSATLPSPVNVRHREDQVQINAPTHKGIYRLCIQNGWRMSDTYVDGKRFPWSKDMVLDCLVANRIITNWQRGEIDHALRFRDDLSHLEFAPIHGPSAHTIAFVAELINTMFHSLT